MRYLTGVALNPPATREKIEEVQAQTGVKFPQEYVRFLLESNGAEGTVGNAAYLMLWKVEELQELNHAYEVPSFAPGLFLFGSNGGGDAYAFDSRSAAMPVIAVPFIGMDLAEVTVLASTFNEFLRVLFNREEDA